MTKTNGITLPQCSTCKERQGYYLDAETIANQQQRIADLEGQVYKLKNLNGELCAEVNEKAGRIWALEAVAMDAYSAWCFECDPYADDFACPFFDGGECTVRRRMEELGLEGGRR